MIPFALCTIFLYGFVFSALFSALRAIRSLERGLRLRLWGALCALILVVSGGVYALLAPEHLALFL